MITTYDEHMITDFILVFYVFRSKKMADYVRITEIPLAHSALFAMKVLLLLVTIAN